MKCYKIIVEIPIQVYYICHPVRKLPSVSIIWHNIKLQMDEIASRCGVAVYMLYMNKQLHIADEWRLFSLGVGWQTDMSLQNTDVTKC